ncbi:MAG: 50S ribosome-binding GTPase [Myxococcaceae bacterium]|nr:50S ribosome-binding GTPase [Myxococcaceae bacterium]
MVLKMQVLLIGNPNAGKSSLFEALTGVCVKIANHAGVTVEQQKACCCLGAENHVEFVDLPGLYSLDALSPEEHLSVDYLNQHSNNLILFVLDSTHLKRNLYLLTQLLEKGMRPLVALTQIDLAQSLGIRIDIPLLERNLGLQVMPVSAKTGEGLKELQVALARTTLHSN